MDVSATTVATPVHLLCLNDISLLARVRRPVVTTWRARHARRADPFPPPARVVAGQELFDLEQVVSWLEVTGSGNNPQARQDAIAFTLTAAEVSIDAAVFAGLTALICLRGATGPLPNDADDLLDAAERFDGDDELLFTELEVLGSRLEPLARYAELLVANAFAACDPFDELVRRRQRGTRHPLVHPALRRLAARTAVVLADQAGFTDPTYVVRRVDDVDLVVGAATQVERRGSVQVAVTQTREEWESADARLTRRWLHVHGLTPSPIVADAEGAYELPDQAVVVLRLPTASTDRFADLDEISNLCLNLASHSRAVVIGPSASLTDALLESRRPGRPPADGTGLSPAGLSRSDALRTGMVRAVVRLPQGLLPEQSRARAALWCLGPSPSTPSSTLCADLTQTLDAGRTNDLVTDLVAAMQGPHSEVARQLSTARFRPTSDLSVGVGVGDLVTPTVREVHLGSAASTTNLLDVLTRAATDVPGIRRPELQVTSEAATLRRTSLDEAVRQRQIVLVPGARVETSATSPGADLPVVRHPADLGRRTELPGLSVIALATAYPHVVLTEPGDIVVTSVGGPTAAVDHLGGLVVAYPARILRCHRPRESTAEERAELAARGLHPAELAEQAFTPEAVAADINTLSADASNWKSWPLTVVPTDQVANLERALAELAERRARLDAARADVDTTIAALTQAVGAQICTVSPSGLTHIDERNFA